MLQLYSDGLTVAAGAAYPLNNSAYSKGCSAIHNAPATISLEKRGIYLVTIDAYGTVADAGDMGVQLEVNGTPRADAISLATTAVGDIASVHTHAIVAVAQNNCPNNCTSAPTTLQVINPSDVGLTDAHINVSVSKLC